MNSVISRIAAAAPAAAVILGFGIGAAEAAPYEVADHSQVQPKPDWNDVLIDDLDSGDPEDEPDDPPADPPADEPADEPAEDDGADADEESDEEAAEDEDTDSPAKPAPAFDVIKTSSGSDENKDASERDTVEAIQTTAAELTPPSQGATGVHVPVLALAAGGAGVAGVAGWAGYRRHRIFAS